MDNSIKFGSTAGVSLSPAPIEPTWILEGNPLARIRVVASSEDGSAMTVIWDCTAGRFNWFYSFDETVYVLEGSVLLKDSNGAQRRVSAGETVHFPTGSHAEWVVDKYIRKIAFCSSPLPMPLKLLRRAWRYAKRTARGASADGSAAAGFQFK